jgi:hypothetical protein
MRRGRPNHFGPRIRMPTAPLWTGPTSSPGGESMIASGEQHLRGPYDRKLKIVPRDHSSPERTLGFPEHAAGSLSAPADRVDPGLVARHPGRLWQVEIRCGRPLPLLRRSAFRAY